MWMFFARCMTSVALYRCNIMPACILGLNLSNFKLVTVRAWNLQAWVCVYVWRSAMK